MCNIDSGLSDSPLRLRVYILRITQNHLICRALLKKVTLCMRFIAETSIFAMLERYTAVAPWQHVVK